MWLLPGCVIFPGDQQMFVNAVRLGRMFGIEVRIDPSWLVEGITLFLFGGVTQTKM